MISFENVTRIFGQDDAAVTALDGVSLTLDRAYTAITGPSGCGKSTLLSAAGGLLPPTDGHVRFNGEDIYAMGEQELHAYRRRRVGYVFQEFNLIPMLTVIENVALPLELDGQKRRTAHERASSALRRINIHHLSDRLPATLSGGQTQRAAIARAMVAGQDMILADEPTGALDSSTRDALLDVFDQLVEDGVRIALVTHDPHVASRAAHIVVMQDGRIVTGA